MMDLVQDRAQDKTVTYTLDLVLSSSEYYEGVLAPDWMLKTFKK